MSSKSARLRRGHAARLRRITRQRQRVRVPQHTVTERKRTTLECQAERKARIRRAGRIRQGAAVAAAGVGASVMAGLMTVPAAASTPEVDRYTFEAPPLATSALHRAPVVSTVPMLPSITPPT